jgi:bifunctional non-homologous end joining protein LigD
MYCHRVPNGGSHYTGTNRADNTGMADRLEEYRRKRDAQRTPEPVPTGRPEPGHGDAFVIQQHHARALHWDLRLERDGVLVSWAVPRGLPRDPARNHLAVHTEDHPMEYADFSGEIPAGEYGAGRMSIYDRGTYTTEKWSDREVVVVLHGERAAGRYVLFRTSGKDWMIHRMDGPPPGWTPMPEAVAPMTATRANALPADDDRWGYELDWPGRRALAFVDGGRLRLAEGERDLTAGYPELRPLAEALAPVECVLDGVLVAFDGAGQVGPPREPLDDPAGTRRLAARKPRATPRARRGGPPGPAPVQYLVTDLLWLDGLSTVDLPYGRRRELLAELGIAGSHWQTPPYFPGGGSFALDAASAQGTPGVLAKRLDSPYQPGRRTRSWLRVPVRRAGR